MIALALFFWAIRNGQYDDMDSQSLKIIMDERRSNQQMQQTEQDKKDTDPGPEKVTDNDS